MAEHLLCGRHTITSPLTPREGKYDRHFTNKKSKTQRVGAPCSGWTHARRPQSFSGVSLHHSVAAELKTRTWPTTVILKYFQQLQLWLSTNVKNNKRRKSMWDELQM